MKKLSVSEFYSRYLGCEDFIQLSFKEDMEARVTLAFFLKLRHTDMLKEEGVIVCEIHAFLLISSSGWWGEICLFLKIASHHLKGL